MSEGVADDRYLDVLAPRTGRIVKSVLVAFIDQIFPAFVAVNRGRVGNRSKRQDRAGVRGVRR